MSKSKKNIIDPVNIIDKYGADTARLFMLSDSPPERKLEWTNNGIEASRKYLSKIWSFFSTCEIVNVLLEEKHKFHDENAIKLRNKTHFYINKTTTCLEKFQYNVAIASLREWSNLFLGLKISNANKEMKTILKYSMSKWTIMISPMIPHLTEELWRMLGYKDYVCDQKWPQANKEFLIEEKVTLVIQVTGKKKMTLPIAKGLSKHDTEKIVLSSSLLTSIVSDKNFKKIIIIPDRIVNFVI